MSSWAWRALRAICWSSRFRSFCASLADIDDRRQPVQNVQIAISTFATLLGGNSMSDRQYWLDLFTFKTWTEFLKAGAKVSGFRDNRWNAVQKIRPGDYLLCYLTGVSRWIGLLEATGKPYLDDKTRIWDYDVFPARVPVKALIVLEPETAVPIFELKNQLSIFRDLKSPNAWTGAVRGSPAKWIATDGAAVAAAIEHADKTREKRPFDPAKLAKTPPLFRAKHVGVVTIPGAEVAESATAPEEPVKPKDTTAHLEIQYLLLKLGSDMGLDVWVARNDRSREYNGARIADIARLQDDLPLQFDEATNNTIELIDVLWLKGKSIQAAFEIESTTSIYSGLLRMSDLIAMQPNLNIPLFLVAPDDRRGKVYAEVNRPTFSRLTPPMTDVCRFIPFSALRERIAQAGNLVRYLRPEFLDDVAETCEIGDE
jgi:hypothetical protein